MKVTAKTPPRKFEAGKVVLSDCGSIDLAPDEQVTFVTKSGGEYDVCRKDWGFYATPSLNGRLVEHGLRAVLVRNLQARYYVMLVEKGAEEKFRDYLEQEKATVVSWLDQTETLEKLNTLLNA